MNYELGSLAGTQEEGAIVLSNDSRFPNATVYNGTNLVECRGFHDMESEVRNGVGWKPNHFEIFREVDSEGEVVNWGFIMLPTLTPATEIAIAGLAENMNVVQGGKGRIEVFREIGRRLPRIVMNKNEKGVKIIAPGVARLIIKDDNVEFREKTGGYREPVDSLRMPKPQYVSFELPLESASFFPKEIGNPGRYFIKSRVRLLRESQDLLKGKIHDTIQNGSFTEGRLRAMVNIGFSVGKTYEEESFA